MGDRDRWVVRPKQPLDLAAIDTRSTDGAPGDKEATAAALPELWDRLGDLQERLYAESERGLLLVLQAMDAGGKDGTIRNVFRGINPLGVHVTAFKAPSEEELAHDFLWRVHAKTPRAGDIGVFNRSHYEDVLIARVSGFVDEDVWRSRYSHIRAFESTLTGEGTTIVKVMLHISRDEQRERLQARVDTPEKRWKFDPADLDERKRWDDYQLAYHDAIVETTTKPAPWYVVPADRKWYRNWAVLRILIETLEDLDPQWPEASQEVAGIVVE